MLNTSTWVMTGMAVQHQLSNTSNTPPSQPQGSGGSTSTTPLEAGGSNPAEPPKSGGGTNETADDRTHNGANPRQEQAVVILSGSRASNAVDQDARKVLADLTKAVRNNDKDAQEALELIALSKEQEGCPYQAMVIRHLGGGASLDRSCTYDNE